MKDKINIKSIGVLLLVLIGFASCKTTKQRAKETQLEDALLWKMEVEGSSEASYIYGTIHMIDKDDYFLPQGTLSAIESSDRMIFEIDLADMNDMGALMGMMGKIFMKDGATLKDLLPQEDYTLVSDYFAEMGLPMMMVDRIKPMFLSAFAMGDIDPNSMQNGDIKSYEMEFYEMAQSRNMETGGLETIDFQISVFDSIPYSDQAIMLVDAIKSNDTANDEFKIMVDMYKNQQINKMVAMISDEDSGYSEHEDILLSKRNKAWIPQMKEWAMKGPTFFAVGAGHLAGKNGVLNLLKKEGVRLTPLSIEKK